MIYLPNYYMMISNLLKWEVILITVIAPKFLYVESFWGSNDATTPPIISTPISNPNSSHIITNSMSKSSDNPSGYPLATPTINVFNMDEWHMKLWEKSDNYSRKLIRESFRDYFTGRNSLEIRRLIYTKLPPLKPREARDVCNPYYSGVDFCGSNGDCEDLSPKATSEAFKENPEVPNFKCSCYSGWEGQFCEKDMNECKYLMCENGAVCYNLLPPEKYRCNCKPYSYGKNCEKTYPRGELGFACRSSDNSSMISWVPETNFKVWDYYPNGHRRVSTSGEVGAMELQKITELSKMISFGQTIGSVANKWLMNKAHKVYLNHEREPIFGDEVLRPPFWLRYEHTLGWNFNTQKLIGLRSTKSSTAPPTFEHVIEIEFPKVVLIKAFVTRGGFEKANQCLSCKRLVTKYKVKMRSGSRKWFKFTDRNGDELVYNAVEPNEKFDNLDDLKDMDIHKPRLRYPPSPFTAEAIRIHVVDWWPKNLGLGLRAGDNLDIDHFSEQEIYAKQSANDNDRNEDSSGRRDSFKKGRKVDQQNPIMRFDVLGCHN